MDEGGRQPYRKHKWMLVEAWSNNIARGLQAHKWPEPGGKEDQTICIQIGDCMIYVQFY